MPRSAKLSIEARRVEGNIRCECIFARSVFEMSPCELSLQLPEGQSIDLEPRQYIRLKVGGKVCPNSHDFDIPVRKQRIAPGTGFIVFQESIEDRAYFE